MARKSDEERLRELEEKMEQIKARKQQVESRLKEKERKARTKRLIEVGAIFEKHFEIEGQEEAEKLAIAMKLYVSKNKEKILNMTKEQLEEWDHKRYEKVSVSS
ncbi:hypothetical protein MXL46_18925 [Heyndrickxia sporothermodurans]|uniref:hypothetical protein n=1 Tax=Heyndrickxia sporothermodurans TaxID=46224 RepID=UPI002DB931E8|nr:hypothetical protein [Heyndrickxia sporothermodurans]MEB6551122.1 hypothetical protein [Heyndrickxia sporothermodurans]